VRRLTLFEFNDSAWCPRFIRDAIVEALGLGLRWGRVYEGVGRVFVEFCEAARCDSVLDLCTGTGEPVSILLDAIARAGAKAPRFVLSDLFPNETAMSRVAARHAGVVEAVTTPVDATAVPANVDRGARSVMSAFHHFPPGLAASILADSVKKGRAIFIAEGFPRSLLRLAAIMPCMALAVLANPFLTGRDRLAKLFFTFVVPVIPVAGAWDALVSNRRIHSEDELRALVAPLGGGYAWRYREVPFFPFGRAVTFSGIPERGPP
jgi:hypothetical protein